MVSLKAQNGRNALQFYLTLCDESCVNWRLGTAANKRKARYNTPALCGGSNRYVPPSFFFIAAAGIAKFCYVRLGALRHPQKPVLPDV